MNIGVILRKFTLFSCGFMCSQPIFADTYYLHWGELKLKAASGVPNSHRHSYQLSGRLDYIRNSSKRKSVLLIPTSTVSKSTSLAAFWAQVNATWNAHEDTAIETMIFEGDITGQLKTKFRCDNDPWLNRTNCVVISSHFSSPQSSIWDWAAIAKKHHQPFTAEEVDLATATHLSKTRTPPPPPKNTGKSFKRPNKRQAPVLKPKNIQLKQSMKLKQIPYKPVTPKPTIQSDKLIKKGSTLKIRPINVPREGQ